MISGFAIFIENKDYNKLGVYMVNIYFAFNLTAHSVFVVKYWVLSK